MLLLLALSHPAFAQTSPIQVTAAPGAGGGTTYSVPVQTLLFFTLLTFLPAVLLMMTSFTRIIIVLSLLRMALGTQTTPPNQVLIGLALFLTFFVMGPTYQQINEDAIQPYLSSSEEQKISFDEAVERAQKPLREFMLKNTYESDLRLFLDMREERPDRESVSLLALIPAFILSELKTAFIIGFYLFIPFLIVDLIVASGLMSMGMMMLPPTVVSLPAKLLVFVLADGWGALVSAILQGYR
ncbi:MAG: flagellar biosynthetic protein FliP [Armatimonadetes bacterium]|nr:MAG: flagellar biosynthetic protein FliP [Armatimonadota bacterium]